MRILVSVILAAWLVAGSGWLLSQGDGKGLETLWPQAVAASGAPAER